MKKVLKLAAQYLRNANNWKRKLFTLTTFALFAFALISATAAAARAATLTVDTTADNAALSACMAAASDCSLRGAIAAAISGDTINFDATVFASAQTITLINGSLGISKNLTITGTGANVLTINGSAADRIFTIQGAYTVVLEKMTLTNGSATVNSSPARRGGAIYNSTNGKITLNNMIVSGNQAVSGGGAIFTTGTNSVINVNNSTVSGNTTVGFGGGIQQANGAINISNSSIINNTSQSSGGGIYSTAAAPITVTNSIISGNTADGYGGGICKDYSVSNASYSLIVKSSTISSNTSTLVGGGIFIITNGATDNSSQTLIQNSTISGNVSTVADGGGVGTQGSGADFINSTVTNNTANGANGGGILSSDSRGTVKLLNTIVAGNTAGANPDVYASPDNGAGSGNFVSYGNNLIGNEGNAAFPAASGDQIGTTQNPINAQLAPLGNNGGTTQTHALLSNSPAINAGNNCVTTSTCAGINPAENLTSDQRASMRAGNVDIGSFEYLTITAASVTVSGRAMTTSGRGIANVRITMIDGNGIIRTATTTAFGYYQFAEVAAGETYIFSVSGRRFSFAQQSQVLSINEDTENINFIGDLSSGTLTNLANR